MHLAETVGYGIDTMRNWKNLTGNEMTIANDISTSTVTFYLTNGREGVREGVNSNMMKVLKFCREPKSRREILEHLGVIYHSKNFKIHINPLVEQGYLELTIPDVPNNRNQKLRLTDKGRQLIS